MFNRQSGSKSLITKFVTAICKLNTRIASKDKSLSPGISLIAQKNRRIDEYQ